MGGFHATKDLLPEAFLLLGALACALLAAFRRDLPPRTFGLVAAGALTAASLSSLVYLKGLPGAGWDAFDGALVVDRLTIFAVPVLCGFTLLTLLASAAIADRVRPHAGEYCALLLTATLGGALLAAARDMVAAYIALELLGVSLCVLVAMAKTDHRGGEAAIKYAVLGAAASAITLYGLALLYGLAGGTGYRDVAAALHHTTPVAALGIALALAGMTFKLGALPFHQWAPDVLEGAPAPVAGLLASLGATAGFMMIARFAVTSFPPGDTTWTSVVAVLAIATMVYGSIAALTQRRLRRLLAYAAVGQAGFVLMGLLGAAHDGVGASLLLLLTSGIAAVGAFAAVSAVEGAGVSDDLDSYRGLSARSPLAAATIAVALLSNVGVPPLVGFFGKLVVLQAAVLSGWGWMLVIASAVTVLGAVCAVRVVRVLYVDAPAAGAEELEPELPALRVALALTGAAIVFLGVLAQPLLHIATAAGQNLP